jgi:Mg2+ and Co2+ transporter CorA
MWYYTRVADTQKTMLELDRMRKLHNDLLSARTTLADVRALVDHKERALSDLAKRCMEADTDAEMLRHHLAAANEQVRDTHTHTHTHTFSLLPEQLVFNREQ